MNSPVSVAADVRRRISQAIQRALSASSRRRLLFQRTAKPVSWRQFTERFRYTSDTVFDTFPWPQFAESREGGEGSEGRKGKNRLRDLRGLRARL